MLRRSPKFPPGFPVVAVSVADEDKRGRNTGGLPAYRTVSSPNSTIASRSSRYKALGRADTRPGNPGRAKRRGPRPTRSPMSVPRRLKTVGTTAHTTTQTSINPGGEACADFARLAFDLLVQRMVDTAGMPCCQRPRGIAMAHAVDRRQCLAHFVALSAARCARQRQSRISGISSPWRSM